jgi:hypothetical protein
MEKKGWCNGSSSIQTPGLKNKQKRNEKRMLLIILEEKGIIKQL